MFRKILLTLEFLDEIIVDPLSSRQTVTLLKKKNASEKMEEKSYYDIWTLFHFDLINYERWIKSCLVKGVTIAFCCCCFVCRSFLSYTFVWVE